MISPMVSVWFTAGALGGLLNAVFVWGTGTLGLNQAMGLAIKPEWSPGFLYGKMVWGGIWGCLLYFLGKFGEITLVCALLVSLAPTAVQLFYVFPFMAKKGMLGKDLGRWTWLYVIAANFVWAAGAYAWLRIQHPARFINF